jgi:hypothetical protein
LPLATHPPETDLLIPLPESGERWDHHLIHTHYFGFSVAEAELGGFVYIRYQPAFPLCQGGVAIFRGTENPHPLDAEFVDFQVTMPYPELQDNAITTANGLRVEFPEPGRVARLSYRSKEGTTEFELTQTAATPLFARGHVMPGEEDHHASIDGPGGTEQIMHCVGALTLHGERFDVDCHAARDRSWRQVRGEDQGGAHPGPPVCWSPMYFGEDLAFNQAGYEAPDTDPAWAELYELPAAAPTHYLGWIYIGGEGRDVTRVHRKVIERHPRLHVALRQEIEAEDESGAVHRFEGRAIAAAAAPAWPNFAFYDTVYRWEDEHGRLSHGTCQEGWMDAFQRAMTNRAAHAAA